MAPHIQDLSRQIVDEIRARGGIDFVEDVAMHVPLIVIAELMGLDPAGRTKLYEWSDKMMAGANLARLEVKTVFEELFRRLPDLRAVKGAPLQRHPNTLVLAIEHLPAVFTPQPG